MDVTFAKNRPRPGQLVRVIRGREAGKYAIVVAVEEPHFVWLADGVQRKAALPKKKNVRHIQLTHYIAREVADSLEKRNGRVSDAELRYALNQYLLRYGERKGE